MTEVNITIQENPIPVAIDTATPTVTITDATTQEVTVLQTQPTVTIANDSPVIVIDGFDYNVTSIETSVVLSSLIGQLTRLHLSTALNLDLEHLEDLWIRLGNEIVLTYPDGVSIQEAGRNYTDQSITDIVADINVSIDGKLDIAYSYIDQTASAIDQLIVSIQGETDARMVVAESRILQTESSITSTVSRLDTIDGPGGSVELLQSSIDQTADSLTLEVAARTLTDGNLISAQSDISLLSDSITLISTTMNELDGRLTSSEIILGEDGINMTVLEEALGSQAYSLSAVQTMLANQWGVTISEDVGGNKYASGFGLLVHPIWLLNTSYVSGDTVVYQDTIYECLFSHTSSVINAPTGSQGNTYWDELPDGVKSVFSVKAEEFYIQTPGGQEPLFTVNGSAVTINTDLVADVIKSSNYGASGESWFKLDSSTGLAKFNNIVMTFSTSGRSAAQSALNVENGADVTDYNAIEAYADAQANLAEVTAKAYADGIVSDEEARAIADAQAKANAAQATAIAYTQGWCEEGATRNTGALADLDYVSNSHVTNVTSIFGGKVNTDRIQSVTGGCYFDLSTGDILLNDISTLSIGTATTYGYLAGYQGNIWLAGRSISTTAPASLGTTVFGLNFNSGGAASTTVQHRDNLIRPGTSGSIYLGSSSYLWNSVWASTMYTTASGYFDVLDDLQALHSMKPKNKNGVLVTDILTLPKEITNYEKLREELQAENGELLSDKDFDELLQDDDELGYRLLVDVGKSTDLSIGAIRQLDNEMSDLLQQVADWVSNIEMRLTLIENGVVV